MMQETLVPEFTITTSREYWEQKTYEEIKKHTYLDPLYDAAFKAFLNDEQALVSFLNGTRIFSRTLQRISPMKNVLSVMLLVTKFRPLSPFGFVIFPWKNSPAIVAPGPFAMKRA